MNPAKRNKLKEVLRAMKGESIDFTLFDKSVAELRKNLEDKIAIPTIEKVDQALTKFKESLDLKPIFTSLEGMKVNLNDNITKLSKELNSKLEEQKLALETSDEKLDKQLGEEINALKVKIASLDIIDRKELKAIEEQIAELKQNADDLEIPDKTQDIKDLNDTLNKFRIEFLSRLAERGGGNMNRQIYINGVDPLKKWTDYNIKAGSNMTITYADNNTTKKVDVTFASSGGGGGGTVRSINSISGNTSAGSTTGTDYVYLCSQALTLTMPTAVGNQNLYTIKNTGTGIVTVAFTGIETGDGQTTLILPVQYTSVDLISDSANWAIT